MSLDKARVWMKSQGRRDISEGRSARELEVLDRICRIALDLGSGHQVLQGVAGSGKSEVVAARARILADAFPSWRILVLCYKLRLASWLRARIFEPLGMRDTAFWIPPEKRSRAAPLQDLGRVPASWIPSNTRVPGFVSAACTAKT